MLLPRAPSPLLVFAGGATPSGDADAGAWDPNATFEAPQTEAPTPDLLHSY